MSIASRIKKFFRVVDQSEYDILEVKCSQLHFLIKQAPLLELPNDLYRLQAVPIKYAYVHPASFAKVARTAQQSGPEHDDWGARISGSKTQWVFTSLLPEGTVIFSPNPMPGVAELGDGNAKSSA